MNIITVYAPLRARDFMANKFSIIRRYNVNDHWMGGQRQTERPCGDNNNNTI